MSGHSLSYPASAASMDVRKPTEATASVAAPAVSARALPRASALSPKAYECVKRGIDVVVVLLASPFVLMVGGLAALAIWLCDRGPIFYTHERVGKDGRPFRFYKFRSMIRDADRLKDQLAQLNQHRGDQRTFKIARDPRITPVGRILRRTSLDELPQLINILKGDMTLVGPRPPLPREVELYSPEDLRRLEVTPGLTCLWQIRGRSQLPFSEQVKLDIEYIDSRCLALDLEILLQTIPAVVLGRGAY